MLKVVVQRKLRERERLCSLPVHLGEAESLHYGILMTEAWPSVRLTKWLECCHFDSRLALVEPAIVDDKVQLRVAGI